MPLTIIHPFRSLGSVTLLTCYNELSSSPSSEFACLILWPLLLCFRIDVIVTELPYDHRANLQFYYFSISLYR